MYANPALYPTSNTVLNTIILPNLYRDSNDDGVPDFFDQYFVGLAPNTLSNILYDVASGDTDLDGASDACETLLAREGDALNLLVFPGPPSLPGDCDGDGTSDVDEKAGAGDGNPFVNTAWVQTGEGSYAAETRLVGSILATGMPPSITVFNAGNFPPSGNLVIRTAPGNASSAPELFTYTYVDQTHLQITARGLPPTVPVAHANGDLVIPVLDNCGDNIDNDTDGFKDKADRECVATGKWDADGDCRTDSTELAMVPPKNMYNTFDFPNVPSPSLSISATGTFDGAISGVDLSALLAWGGATDNGPPNANGADYDSDNNGDHRDDGRDYDFASPAPGELGWSQDGVVGGSDLSKLLGLSPVGRSCG